MRTSHLLRQQASIWNNALSYLAYYDVDAEQEIQIFLNSLLTHGRYLTGIDIGCGFGRHTVFAASAGFEMTAVDFTELAVLKTREQLRESALQAGVIQASMTDLPFTTAYFDFGFSWCVFNHGTKAVFETALREAVRVLRTNGLLYFLVMSRRDSRYGFGGMIEPNCYVFSEGPERGIVHYFPSTEDIVASLRDCKLIKLEECCEATESASFYHPEGKRSCYFSVLAQKR